jgi:hypothetical protein
VVKDTKKSTGLQAQNLSRLALGDDFKGAATNLTIGCESLLWDAGVHRHFECLAAERALDWLKDFHANEPVEIQV